MTKTPRAKSDATAGDALSASGGAKVCPHGVPLVWTLAGVEPPAGVDTPPGMTPAEAFGRLETRVTPDAPWLIESHTETVCERVAADGVLEVSKMGLPWERIRSDGARLLRAHAFEDFAPRRVQAAVQAWQLIEALQIAARQLLSPKTAEAEARTLEQRIAVVWNAAGQRAWSKRVWLGFMRAVANANQLQRILGSEEAAARCALMGFARDYPEYAALLTSRDFARALRVWPSRGGSGPNGKKWVVIREVCRKLWELVPAEGAALPLEKPPQPDTLRDIWKDGGPKAASPVPGERDERSPGGD